MTTKRELIKQGYERVMLAYNYRKEGLTYNEICTLMGVSMTRVRQLIEKAERIHTQNIARATHTT